MSYRSRSSVDDLSDETKIGCCLLLIAGYVVGFVVLFNVLRPIVAELLPGTSEAALGGITLILVLVIGRLLRF